MIRTRASTSVACKPGGRLAVVCEQHGVFRPEPSRRAVSSIPAAPPDPPERGPWRRAWMVWSGIVLGVLALYFTALRDPWQAIAYDIVAFGAAAAVLLGVRLHHPLERRGWLFLGAGTAAWAIGDSIWTLTEILSATVSFPSAADAVYLAGYLLLGAGVVALGRARGVTRATVRDALTLGLAMGTLGVAPVIAEVEAAPMLSILFAVA